MGDVFGRLGNSSNTSKHRRISSFFHFHPNSDPGALASSRTSTDEDDARLLTSGTFETLDEAIVDLKKQIARLASVLLGVDVGF